MEQQWIVSDPKVMMGKPVVAGTRITVELIFEKLAAGETIAQILDVHPRLSRGAIQAALAFAAEALRADVVHPIAETARWTFSQMRASISRSSSVFGRTATACGMWPRWSEEIECTST